MEQTPAVKREPKAWEKWALFAAGFLGWYLVNIPVWGWIYAHRDPQGLYT